MAGVIYPEYSKNVVPEIIQKLRRITWAAPLARIASSPAHFDWPKGVAGWAESRGRQAASPLPSKTSAVDRCTNPAPICCLRFALPEFRTSWRFRAADDVVTEVPVSGSVILGNALSLRVVSPPFLRLGG